MPDNKQKTKVYTNKKEFDKANQAYNDSLNLYNQSEKAKELFLKDKDGSTLEERLKLSDQSENITNRTKDEPVYRYFKNFRNPNTLDKVKYFNDFPEEDNVVGFKKPTTKPIYEEIKPKPKIEPIKPLGIKPMNTSVEPKLADKKQEIIQEPMNKKQTYTASPNLKKMGKSTGREYVDGQWIETKSKGGTVKKYAVAGTIPPVDATNLLGSVDPSTISNLTKPFQSKMPVTGASAPAASGTGSNFQLPSLGGGSNSAPQQTSQDPNAPKKKNIGKIVGSVVGGVAGSVIAPGIGTMIGSTIGGGIGGAIDNKTYQNKVEDYNATAAANKSSQQNAMTSNIAGNFNPNAQTKQFKKGGGLIKRADGSYSQRGLWDNIRANKGSGKTPTKKMLKQEKKIKANMAHGGIDTSNSMSGPKYLDGGMLKPMGNNMYEVKSYKKGTDKVEYRPNVFIDNKEIIRKNPDGSTQILSDDLGYAKVAKNIARAKGGNITDGQFDQLYMNQEMSKASKGKGNKYVDGGTDKKLKLRYPMSDDRATSVANSNALLMNELKFTPPEVKDEGFVNLDGTREPSRPYEYMKRKSFAPMSVDINRKPFLVSPTGPKDTKNFQDWLDINQPTWLKGKSLNKGAGYGTYGPNTTAAYKKYGNDYENMMMDQQRRKDLDLKPMSRIGQNPKQLNPELAGKIEEVPSMPTSKPLDKPGNKSLDTKVNPLGYLSTLPSAAYDIAQGLKGGDPVDFERMNTKYQFADPRGAMAAASRGVTSAYNAAKNAAKTTTTSAGEYLANMGNLASKEGMEKASALTAIKAQYDMANTQGLNQTNLAKDQYNAQTQMQESIARQQEQDAARNAISQGLSNIGQNTMGYTSERNRAKSDKLMAGMLNENYEVVYNKDTDSYEIQPKKGKKSGSNVISTFGEPPKKEESSNR